MISKSATWRRRPFNIFNGAIRTVTIVGVVKFTRRQPLTSQFLCFLGEILEKATRMLTEEEKAQMEVPFVGKNGTTRKVEVVLLILLKSRC